jgi:hypothetical protein
VFHERGNFREFVIIDENNEDMYANKKDVVVIDRIDPQPEVLKSIPSEDTGTRIMIKTIYTRYHAQEEFYIRQEDDGFTIEWQHLDKPMEELADDASTSPLCLASHLKTNNIEQIILYI